MGIVKGILIAIYLVIALVLIVLTLIQTKEDPGLSSTITGSSTNNFYEKNKSRTKEGKQKKWTVILSVVFVVLTIALGIVYMA
ncbi:MAG TPA: preprotein translocase subunit SecG [Clostridiaceae bacterium]|jgi:protein translocase, SecG subunit|nr:preprotein translocase subunit SecG [Clostridia bacterium]CDC06389.1 protein translocase SecG subunit [Clostridium sp. CAG:343]HCF35040.1 preprotein translocase subunit SecG [Clostridiales bacterium]HJJ18057.1 preprotein translocase subunit SecG [Clostridiaceae bacterium]MBP8633786.1 preprotein translocase subunit SecG [Clostridia bacterium]